MKNHTELLLATPSISQSRDLLIHVLDSLFLVLILKTFLLNMSSSSFKVFYHLKIFKAKIFFISDINMQKSKINKICFPEYFVPNDREKCFFFRIHKMNLKITKLQQNFYKIYHKITNCNKMFSYM